MNIPECQFHTNCGGFCENQEEVSMNLCCDCLQANKEDMINSGALKELFSIVCQSSSAETSRDFFNCACRYGFVNVVDKDGDFKVNNILYKIVG